MATLIQLGPDTITDLSRALAREWLETNRLGGWASSTLAGAHTRRYHGLLVVATRPPVGRVVLLSRLEETLLLERERVELGCNLFPGAVRPQGHRFLQGFALDPFPVFTYAAGAFRLRKTLAMLEGEHTLLMVYELERAPAPVGLELRPFFAGRDYHHLTRANNSIQPSARLVLQKICCAFNLTPTSLWSTSWSPEPTLHLGRIGTTTSNTRARPSAAWTTERTC